MRARRDSLETINALLLLGALALELGLTKTFLQLAVIEEERDDLVGFGGAIGRSARGRTDDGILHELLVAVGPERVSSRTRQIEPPSDLPSQLDDTLIDGVLGDKTVDGDLLRLTETMSAVHSLSVVLCRGKRESAWRTKRVERSNGAPRGSNPSRRR